MGTEIALIFGSVTYVDWAFLVPLRGRVTTFCADGGMVLARRAGFEPRYYIGDNDSGGAPEEGVEAVQLLPEKNVTDLQAAYEHARDLGFRRMVFTACTGERQDHHLANLNLLERAAAEGVEASIVDPWNEVRFLGPGVTEADCGEFTYCGIVPMDRELKQVRIENAKYPLDVPTVRRGDSLTVSNEPLCGPVRIAIGDGHGWLVLSERKI